MKTIAVFVEGASELITVREYLVRKFDSNVSLKCYEMFSKGKYKSCAYELRGHNPEYHFTIYDVGGEGSVVNQIIDMEGLLWSAGYSKIIGLKDMFSPTYRKISSVVNDSLNNEFIQGHSDQINKAAKRAQDITFCFAIMEVEAWYLGCNEVFQELNDALTPDAILNKIGTRLEDVDPETAFLHPAKTLGEILSIANISYGKHEGDIEKICNALSTSHYQKLYDSQICNSFNKFIDSLEAV